MKLPKISNYDGNLSETGHFRRGILWSEISFYLNVSFPILYPVNNSLLTKRNQGVFSVIFHLATLHNGIQLMLVEFLPQ